MIKNSLINSVWTLEVLDATDTVLNTYTFNTQWLDNFTDAIANGAGAPMGDWGFDAIKFGYGTSPTISGMIGIEKIINCNSPVWPDTDAVNVIISTTFNSSTNYYTKTSTETQTILVGPTETLLPGTVITEVGGCFNYYYNSAEYTDVNWLPIEYSSDLYESPTRKYNPLCATRGLILDDTSNPVSITLLDGQKLRYTIVTSIEFKLNTNLINSPITVYNSVADEVVNTTVTFEYEPYNSPNSYIGQAPLGPVCATSWIGCWRAISSTAVTAEDWIPFVFDHTINKFVIDPTSPTFNVSGLDDIQYIDITDWESVGAPAGELTLGRITFDPPIPVTGGIELDLQFSRFIEPKFLTTPGTIPDPVFTPDPDLTLLPNWESIAKTSFPGKDLQIITDTTAQTITLKHNSNSYTYSYASGANAATANVDLELTSNITNINMSPDEATIGYYAPIFDDTTYYVNGDAAANTTINLALRDSDNFNNFAETQIVLDVTRPTYNPMSTGPFLSVVATGNMLTSLTCTDLSNYSLVPGPDAFGPDICAVRYSTDGNVVAVGNISSPYLQIYNADTWTLLPDTIPSLSGSINWMDFSADGTKLAIAHSGSPYCTVLNTSDWSVISTPVLPGTGMCVKFSNDSSKLAIGHVNGKRITVLNTTTWIAEAGLPTLPQICVAVDWNSDDSQLAIAHYLSPFLRVLDTTTWLSVPGLPVSSGIETLVYNGDGSQLIVGSGLSLKVYQTSDWSLLHDITVPGSIYEMDINLDGSVLGVLHQGGSILSLFNTTTWQALPDSTWIDANFPRSISFRP